LLNLYHDSDDKYLSVPSVPRYEKALRRLDTDHDGQFSIKEFRQALKRLRYKDYNKWTTSMVKKLFTAINKNDSNRLEITKFCDFIRDEKSENNIFVSQNEKQNEKRDHQSDEEDDVFTRHRALTDQALFKKVSCRNCA
jgi:hypothetical protein